MPFKARKAVFEKLEEIADVASLSKEERERYQNSVNVYRTHLCVMDAAKEEGREEGRMEERKSLLALIAKMSAGGDADQIATLYDPEVMNARQEKYGIR